MPDRAQQTNPRSRVYLTATLAIVIAMGLGSRKYGDSLPGFVADNAGDALWTVAALVALAIVFPGWSSIRLGVVALSISVGVEFSQLIDTPILNSIRANGIGRLFLGRGFVWLDLIRYSVGAIVATAIDRACRPRRSRWPDTART